VGVKKQPEQLKRIHQIPSFIENFLSSEIVYAKAMRVKIKNIKVENYAKTGSKNQVVQQPSQCKNPDQLDDAKLETE